MSIAEDIVSHKVFVENLDAFLLAGLLREERRTPMPDYGFSDEAALLDASRTLLRQRIAQQQGASNAFTRAAALGSTAGAAFAGPLSRIGQILYLGAKPEGFEKPRYGTPAYAMAVKVGWITLVEERADRLAQEQRRARALATCHRPSWTNVIAEDEAASRPERCESRAYVPCLSAALDDDPYLTDGARRCARKLAELTYRRNREGRSLDVTVTYLMAALKRSRRTVQRYLRALEREGYIAVHVIASKLSRMSVGLEIKLCARLFAAHHKKRWPPKAAQKPVRAKPAKPGAPRVSDNEINSFSLSRFKSRATMFSVEAWALRCAEGVWRRVNPPCTGSLWKHAAT